MSRLHRLLREVTEENAGGPCCGLAVSSVLMLMPSSSRRAKEVYTRAARGEQPPAGSRAVVKPWDRARGGGYRAWVMPGPQVQSQTGRPCSGVIDDSMVMGCQQQEGLQGSVPRRGPGKPPAA